MYTEPLPRNGVYELYWYFASERQRIFENRLTASPFPWTNDLILRSFKFCNVFRATDRVSQFLIRNVAYHREHCSPEDRLFQILAFRLFSKVETWDAVHNFLGHTPVIADLRDGAFARALDHVRLVTGRLYTGAFILCATKAYGHELKHHNHVDLLRHMFVKDRLGARLLEAKSLRSLYELLRTYPLMGDFMSYQIAIDLNYSDLINFSENEFTQPGPGALRGMKKVFSSFGSLTPSEIILWMVEKQGAEFERLDLPFRGLWGRPLHAIDCQGLFCETDKYCREAVPELISARTRIKARFTASEKPLKFFFPPKWRLSPKGAT